MTNHKLEEDLLAETEKLNEKTKAYTALKLQHDALKKNSEDKIKFLTKQAEI